MAKLNTEKETTKYINNIVPLLAYLDIFKNYYANKQESKFYYMVKTAYVETKLTNDKVIYDITVTPMTTRSGSIEIANMTLAQWNDSGEYIVTGKQIGRASCRERVSSPV